jgi:hypothetical protein
MWKEVLLMICSNCGATNQDDAVKCIACGANQNTNQNFSPNSNQNFNQNTYQNMEQPVYQRDPYKPSQPMTPPINPVFYAKKKSHKAIILISILVVAMLAGGFFTVKAFFARDLLNLVNGNDKYAKMVEKSVVTEAGNNALNMLDGISAMATKPKKDFAYEEQQKVYFLLDAKIADYADKSISMQGFSSKFARYINDLDFKTKFNYNGGQTQIETVASDSDGTLLTFTGFNDSNNNTYLKFPEVSSTYFLMKNSPIGYLTGSALKNYSYDHEKMKSSIDKLTSTISNSIDQGTTTITKDVDFTIHGVGVTAEKVTVSITGEQATALFKNSNVSDSDYLDTFVSENTKKLAEGNSTLQKYFDDALKPGENDFDSAQEFTFSSYVTPSNTVAAQTVDIKGKNKSGNPTSISLNFIFSASDNPYAIAFSYSEDGREDIYVTKTATSLKNGNVDISFQSSDPAIENNKERIGIRIDYSDFSISQFMGSPTILGTFKASVLDPQSFINALHANLNDADRKTLNDSLLNSTFTVTNSFDLDGLHTDLNLYMDSLITVKLTQTTVEKTSEKISQPDLSGAETIDISQDKLSSADSKKQANFSTSLSDYMTSLLKNRDSFRKVFLG